MSSSTPRSSTQPHSNAPSTPGSPPESGPPGSKKRAKVTRSKDGCLCCRKRRKRCDMERPDCSACQRLRLVSVHSGRACLLGCRPVSGPKHGRGVSSTHRRERNLIPMPIIPSSPTNSLGSRYLTLPLRPLSMASWAFYPKMQALHSMIRQGPQSTCPCRYPLRCSTRHLQRLGPGS